MHGLGLGLACLSTLPIAGPLERLAWLDSEEAKLGLASLAYCLSG